jgi:hypothetical protein
MRSRPRRNPRVTGCGRVKGLLGPASHKMSNPSDNPRRQVPLNQEAPPRISSRECRTSHDGASELLLMPYDRIAQKKCWKRSQRRSAVF